MQDVEILHREAMELVSQAVNARQRGDTTIAKELIKAARSSRTSCRKPSGRLIRA